MQLWKRSWMLAVLCALLAGACRSDADRAADELRREGESRFERLKTALSLATDFTAEHNAMADWNQWIISNPGNSFGLRWTDSDGTAIAHTGVPEWLAANPDAEVWLELYFGDGDQRMTFRHRLVDQRNWALLTMNE